MSEKGLQEERRTSQRTNIRYALSFYGTIGFLGGFFGARIFATLNPTVVLMRGGVHFHHFWYGLAMVIITGWLGLALRNEQLDRTLALIFGLGVGFIGDEAGLLLTFGDYTSELTLWFFLAAVATIILGSLVWRFRTGLEKDVLNIRSSERLTHIGLFIALFSSIFFAFGSLVPGLLFVSTGILFFLIGREQEHRRS